MTVTTLGLQSRAGHTWLPDDPEVAETVAGLRESIQAWAGTWHGPDGPCDCQQCNAVASVVALYDDCHMVHANLILDTKQKPKE